MAVLLCPLNRALKARPPTDVAYCSDRSVMSEGRPRTPPPWRERRRRSAAGMVGGGMGVQDGDQEGDDERLVAGYVLLSLIGLPAPGGE